MRGVFSSKRHLLFDLDGTLVDSTAAAHAKAFIDALRDDHPALARCFYYPPFAGRPTREVFAEMNLAQEPELTRLVERKQRLFREAMERSEVAAFSGARRLLVRLRDAGRRRFVVTGASRRSAERMLEIADLHDLLDGVVTSEDTSRGKPAPEPYLLALKKHNLPAAECLVIEDGESGVRSAQAAGLDVVSIHFDSKMPGILNSRDFAGLSELLFA